MKAFLPALFAAALAAATSLPAATFEGKVTMKITDPRGGSHELEQHIKDGLVRTDLSMSNGRTVSMIMDVGKHEVTILMPEQHMYMVHPMPSPAATNPEAAQAPDDSTLEKTGETEKILGCTCTKYVSKSHDAVTDLWVTDELGPFPGLSRGPGPMGMGRRAGPPKPAWETALAGKDFFPLRVVSHGPDGAEKFRLEVTAIDRTPQPAALFAPPADYHQFDVGAMMQGMGLPPRQN